MCITTTSATLIALGLLAKWMFICLCVCVCVNKHLRRHLSDLPAADASCYCYGSRADIVAIVVGICVIIAMDLFAAGSCRINMDRNMNC